MAQIVEFHKGPYGKRGFTFRDLCPKLHVAAESLRAAIEYPGRLSVTSVVALADLMGEDPMLLLSDILAEMKSKPNGEKKSLERARSVKPKVVTSAPSDTVPAEKRKKAVPKTNTKARTASKAKAPTRSAPKK